MNWLVDLFVDNSAAHTILLISLVIAIGLVFSKIKLGGISLGMSWILFVGIFFGDIGLQINSEINNFILNFGLILFVFSLGLQVGPGFFSSVKKEGLKFYGVALIFIVLTVLVTYAIQIITSTPSTVMVGVMNGAVINTPALGAAQQIVLENTGVVDNSMAMAYAVTYPLGVVGVIFAILLIKVLFKVDVEAEKHMLHEKGKNTKDSSKLLAIEVKNEALNGLTIYEIDKLIERKFVISRLYHSNGEMEIPQSKSVINVGDKLFLITSNANEKSIVAFFGLKIEMSQADWEKLDTQLVSDTLYVTNSEVNGKKLGDLKIRAQYGINITRITRAGVDLIATSSLELQLGDAVHAVGSERSIAKSAKFLGNAREQLDKPNLIPIFLGIFLGIIVGSVPIMFPGITQPVKLGLASGPLLVAIVIARFGPKLKLVTYTTLSANKMLNEVGLALFLAAVGIGAGDGFTDAVVNGGYYWVLEGILITMIPIIIGSFVAKYLFKMDFFSLVGLICGVQTNAVALSYADNSFKVPQMAVAYATLYPIAMLLRVVVAQIMAGV